MPKATKKKLARAPAKAKPKPKPASNTATRATKGVDPRVVAAISLALHDESVSQQRDEQLQSEASQWTVLARARGVRSR